MVNSYHIYPPTPPLPPKKHISNHPESPPSTHLIHISFIYGRFHHPPLPTWGFFEVHGYGENHGSRWCWYPCSKFHAGNSPTDLRRGLPNEGEDGSFQAWYFSGWSAKGLALTSCLKVRFSRIKWGRDSCCNCRPFPATNLEMPWEEVLRKHNSFVMSLCTLYIPDKKDYKDVLTIPYLSSEFIVHVFIWTQLDSDIWHISLFAFS